MIRRRRVYAACALALFVAAAPRTSAQQDDNQVIESWSDPGRPGTVELKSPLGGMTIKGSNRRDVLVIGRREPQPSAGGLKAVTQSGGFSVKEEHNVMGIESLSQNRTLDFEVHVPLRTNLKIQAHSGVITIDNVEGDMELSHTNGSIVMTNVGGSIVANSNNGEVKATMTRLTASKAMAFTTLNGTVDVTLPAASKATLKLRSDMGGDVFTDFDIQKTPSATPRRDGGGRGLEVSETIHGTINGGGPEISLRTFNGNVYLRKGR